jgi:hypothetical protein
VTQSLTGKHIGSIAATWSYISSDASSGYRVGNTINTATAASVILAAVGLVLWQKWENRLRASGGRDDRLRLSPGDVALLGSLHPDFRYIH